MGLRGRGSSGEEANFGYGRLTLKGKAKWGRLGKRDSKTVSDDS